MGGISKISLKSIPRWLLSTASAAVFAIIIYLFGQALAQTVPKDAITLPSQTKKTLSYYMDMLTSKNTYRIAQKYIIALTDSTVQFEELPSYRTDIPFAVIAELYDCIEIESITITGLDIQIEGKAISDFYPDEIEDTFETVYGISDVFTEQNGDKISIEILTEP